MSDPFVTETNRGLYRLLTLDGADILHSPDSLSVRQQVLTTRVQTADGGSRSFSPWFGAGFPDRVTSYTFSLPMSHIDGASLAQLSRAMERSGYRTFAYWKPRHAIYTATAGQVSFYLPKYRRNAGQVFAGLIYEGHSIDNTSAPFKVWVKPLATGIQTALTVGYVNGPSVTTPATGNATIARDPSTTTGFVEFRVGTALAAGDEVMIEYFPVYMVEMTEASIEYPQATDEQHTYVFTER